MSPDAVDLNGLLLTGYDIKDKKDQMTEPEPQPVQPVGPGGGGGAVGVPVYLVEIIERLNDLFGEATPLKDRAVFAEQTLSILSDNALVMAQIQSSEKDLAMKGNLPGAVTQAVVRAMRSHSDIAALLLKDPQTMAAYTGFLFDLLKEGRRIELDLIETL